ncbi:hypothetical protein CKO25_12285 [Thiocapsa imhoffii]|uniref:Inner membrane protein YgaP-like transmembrane domain-containing protein n=1 Tax=Thiocapsa imhoffii TaxID=382777 RepID=A0A9X1B9K8_9GAMM|nr:DUF2892 domain-containing protein [Thiocapsa imhoffii]MBK1645408.1 hypothetical protein [Thiocapsa imhoffii]
MELTKNMGEQDRKIRLIAGVVILLWAVVAQSWLGIIGLILLGTAYVRSCPAYTLMKMDTLEKTD